MITFTIPGEPVAKGRPQFSVTHSGVRARTPEKTRYYENYVKCCFLERFEGRQFDDDAQIAVMITAYFQTPKNTSKVKRQLMEAGVIRPTKRPDLDNIIKAICDSLNGIAYRDDAQIVKVTAVKFYSDEPRVTVSLFETGISRTAKKKEGKNES